MFRVEFKASITKRRTLAIENELITYDDQQMNASRIFYRSTICKTFAAIVKDYTQNTIFREQLTAKKPFQA